MKVQNTKKARQHNWTHLNIVVTSFVVGRLVSSASPLADIKVEWTRRIAIKSRLSALEGFYERWVVRFERLVPREIRIS